jgi:hypothetical protein
MLVSLYPRLQILDYGGSEWPRQNALAYHDSATITAVNFFIVQAHGGKNVPLCKHHISNWMELWTNVTLH